MAMKRKSYARKAKIKIRTATESDVSDVMEIGLQCFPNTTLDQCFTKDYLRLLMKFQKRSVLIAEIDGEKVGFIVLHSYEKDRIGNVVAWLLWLGVSQKHRREGYGVRLMHRAIDEMHSRGVSKIFYVTKTKEENPAINHISKKLSFKAQDFVFLYAKMEVFEKWLDKWERLFPERDHFTVRHPSGFVDDDLAPVLKLASEGVAFPTFEKLTSFFTASAFKHFIYPLEPNGIFVVEKGKNIIGFCQAQTFWQNKDYDGKNAWIFNMVSYEKYANLGAFTSLLKKCKRYFKERQVRCVSFWMLKEALERKVSLFQEFTSCNSLLWAKMLNS